MRAHTGGGVGSGVDCEGRDAEILRSLVSYCYNQCCVTGNDDAWPLVIHFETMGHCDKVENCKLRKLLLER